MATTAPACALQPTAEPRLVKQCLLDSKRRPLGSTVHMSVVRDGRCVRVGLHLAAFPSAVQLADPSLPLVMSYLIGGMPKRSLSVRFNQLCVFLLVVYRICWR